MSKIFFIRHAETNMAGTFCGHSNPGLNARGRMQLLELIHSLHAEDVSEIYASDLLRAKETGQGIAEFFAIECHLRPALREINFGQWEGLTWEDIEQRDSAHAQHWLAEYPNLPAPDGECFADFEKRVLDEMELLMPKIQSRNIAVVSHAGVLRTVLSRLYGYSEDECLRETDSYCSVIQLKTPMPSAMRFIATRT
jgi:alpha-ribazole phosphatase